MTRSYSLKIELSGSPEAIQASFARMAKAVAAGDWDSYELNAMAGGGAMGSVPYSINASVKQPEETPLSAAEIRKLRGLLRS